MKTRIRAASCRLPFAAELLLLLLLSILNSQLSTAFAQTTAFSYQGRLSDGASPANGIYDLRFTIFDSTNNPGLVLAGPLTNSAVPVGNGLFTVTIDFGAGALNGADLWLEVAVRSNSLVPFTPLSPRQQVTATPYAIRAANFSGAVSSSQLPANVARLDASNQVFIGKVQLGNVSNTFSGTFTGDGSGLNNVPGTLRWQIVSGTFQQAQSNAGYIATNATEVTIALPILPNVGDTLRVSGQGSGGWRITQNAGQSILGINLGAAGATWTARDTNRAWQAVASSADGTKLVAVVSPGQIYTSTDSGATWTARDASRNWRTVASSADGTRLVAGVTSGQIYTSTDSGLTWTPHDSSRSWESVASSADGTKLIASVFNGQLYTSTNSGTNWIARDSTRPWRGVASSADGSKLVAVENGSLIHLSTNSGVAWTVTDTNRNWVAVTSSADGSRLAAVANPDQIYVSTDSGASWTPRESSRNWISIASSADGTKLAANITIGASYIFTSADSGTTWTPREHNRLWAAIASSADGNKLVAVESGGQIYTSAASSTAGITGSLTGGQGATVELQYAGNGQFIPLSHEGTLVLH